ncbi:MAG: antitoxin [Betaproteobacteria bacterium]
MRTTVTIDPDVEVLLRRAVRDSGAPFKQVLNDAVRNGLRGTAPRAPTSFKLPVAHMGAELVDLTQAGALAAEFEDRALATRLRKRR